MFSKIFDKYNVLSPRTTTNYTRKERGIIKKAIKKINKEIRAKTKNNNNEKGVWLLIEVEINELLSEKICKTLIYLISKKRWQGVHYEHCQNQQHTVLCFKNPLAYDNMTT